MEFMEACEAMEQGKICISDGVKYRIVINNRLEYYHKINEHWRTSVVHLSEHAGRNWVLFEEKKTLSDKIDHELFAGYHERDVKEFLKEFIKWLGDDEYYCDEERLKRHAKNHFGERLAP